MSQRTYRGTDQANPSGTTAAGWLEAIAFWLPFSYFAVKTVYFALRIGERIFPDEASWFGMVQVFSRSWWLPADSPESYHLGLISHSPNLYFFLMGKLLSFNVLPIHDLIYLRLVNVVLSLLTVIVAWRLAKVLSMGLAVRALFFVMLTNTVMFTFTAGAVTYDNLATLFAGLALLYLLRFVQGRETSHCLMFCLFTLAGTLTKNVMLPYGVALLLVAIFYERRRLPAFLKALPGWLRTLRWRESILLVLCLAGLAANLVLYGGNRIHYGVWVPTMDKVLPVADCLKHRLFARDYVVREFKSGRLAMLDAQRLALAIRDPGDRASAWNQLAEAAKANRQGPPRLKGRLQYAVEWVQVVVARTYSVAAHLSLFKYDRDFYPYYALFSLAAVLWVIRFRDLLTPGMGGVCFVVLFYLIVLMQVNYIIYRGTGFSGVALTGRYLFPILAPLYLTTAHALLSRLPRWWQLSLALAVAAFFVSGEFPWFLRQAGPEWYLQ